MVYGSSNFFVTIIQEEYALTVSAGYEGGKFRVHDLTKLMLDVLPEFSLSYEELDQVKYTNAVVKLREAAAAFYDKEESERGEAGEVALHLLLRDYFGTFPVASKIYFTDSNNSNVKGFDVVHAKVLDGNLKIFVGESKLTKTFDSAMASLKEDIEKHLLPNFLRKEFLFVGRKVSKEWPLYKKFMQQIDAKRSVDEIKDGLIFVTFAAYECPITNKHNQSSQEFKKELEDDIQEKLERMVQAFGHIDVSLAIILLPIHSKSELRKSFDQRLRAAKGL